MSAPLNPALISPGSLSSRLGHFKHRAQCIGIFYGIKCYSVNNTHSCFSWISSSLTKRNRNVWCPGTPITGVNLSWPHETTSGILVFLGRNVQGSCHFLQSLFPLFTGNVFLLITWLGSLNSGQKLLQQVPLISMFPFPKYKRWKIPTGAIASCHAQY